MRKSTLEIIDETVAYYSTDPANRRGILNEKAFTGNNRCDYLTPDGRMCAVGRCVEDPSVLDNQSVSDKMGLKNGDIADLESLLKEEYRGHPIDFWVELQNLHDLDQHWCKTGLTTAGEQVVKNIKEAFVPQN